MRSHALSLCPIFVFAGKTEMRARIRREVEAAKTEIEFKPCQTISGFQLPLKPLDQ